MSALTINMGPFETVIRYSKELEGLLAREFSAMGRGIHEKISSVEDRCPADLVRKIRFVATVRNKLVHDDGYEIEDLDRFVLVAEQALDGLRELADQPAPLAYPQERLERSREQNSTPISRSIPAEAKKPSPLPESLVIGGVAMGGAYFFLPDPAWEYVGPLAFSGAYLFLDAAPPTWIPSARQSVMTLVTSFMRLFV